MKPKSALRSFLAITGSSLLAISYSHAATLYWDGGDSGAGAPSGGGGAWETAGYWDNTQSADSSSNWVDGNIAYFGGATTPSTVTLGTNISVGGLRFDTRGYTISTGANSLSFGTGDNNILLNGNTTTGGTSPVTATITGAVGGAGNAIFSFGAIQAWGGGFQHLGAFGVITLNGTSTTGWSGTTTVKQGMTLALAGSNQGLVSTSGITLLGGTRNAQAGTAGGSITITNTNNTEAGLDRVSSAAITSYGGNITVTNTAAAVTSYSETMGALDLRLGTLNVTQTNALSSGTQTLTFGSDSLTNVNGVARTNATTSAITFSGTSLGANARNSIIITGQTDSGVGEIIAPWATYGASAGVQTDYASYNRTAGGAVNAFGVQGAAIAASGQSTWSTAHALTSNYTLTNTAGSAANGRLSATRIVNTVKNTSSALNFSGATVSGNAITQAGTSFVDGDAVVLSAALGGGATAANTVYYVTGASGTTFSLAATPGGTPLTVTSVSGNITGGISLSSGNNLETYGILNASAERLAIGGATGAGTLSTPSGGGNLYLTTGNTGNIIINAPITNAVGGGAVTVVRNGGADGASLILSGNNSFTGGLVLNTGNYNGATRLVGTQSFTGGVILDGGSLGDGTTPLTAAALNDNAITVNGLAQIFAANGATLSSSSSITINSTGALDIGASGTVTVNGAVSGTGTLLINHGNTNSGSTVILANSANTFTGNVVSSNFNGGRTLYVNSFGDGGKVTVGYNSANQATPGTKIFGLNSTASTPLTFNTRQFELIGPATGNIDNLGLANNSAQAFTINTDLLVNALGTRTLTLQGTNAAGVSTFGGKLENGSLTSLGVTKSEAGTWILSNTANSYSGRTTITAGTLQVAALANGGSNSSIGASSSAVGNLILNGGTLRYSGGSVSTDRNFALTASSSIDASGTAAVNFSQTGAVSPDQTLTGDVAASKVVTNLSSTADLVVGMRVTGTGIAANSTIASIDSATQITLNNTPTAGTGVSLSFGYTASARTLTLTGTNTGANTIAGILQNTSAVTLGVLSLTKSGTGTWVLTNANTYTGTTTASGGVLKLDNATALPGGTAATGGTSGLTINGGGIVGLTANSGNFSRALGTTVSTVQFGTGGGGFAAYGGDRTVNLGGTGATAQWNAGSFVPSGHPLILSAADADGTLIFANPINFNGSARTIQVNNGSAAVDASLNGALSGGSPSGLNKTGTGTLEITSASNSYSGATTVADGTLRLGANDVLPNTTNVTIAAATLDAATFDDTVGTLDVTAAATINLGSGANLAFAASNLVDWTGGTLNITGNFVPGDGSGPGSNPGSLRFGTTNAGLTSGPGSQLSQITASGWTNFGLDAFGYLTAIPTGGNTTPTISNIANQSIPSGTNTGALAFTVGDLETPVGSLVVTASSSNLTLVPNANIGLGGSGASRTVTVTPVSGLVGSATITVTVTDGGSLTAQDTFTLTVTENYLSWATANGVTGGEGGDHDSDGVKNLVEYALVDGGERGVFNPATYTITYNKRGGVYGTDLTYDIESSTGLTGWSVLAKPPVVETSALISYTFTPVSPVKNFARLKVVKTP